MNCVCGSSVDLDVIIVVDSSGSIPSEEFPKLQNFTASLISQLGPSARVGLINFSGKFCSDYYSCTSDCLAGLVNRTRKWCMPFASRFQLCPKSERWACTADGLQIASEVVLGSPNSIWNNGFANASKIARNMTQFGESTHTAAVLRIATDMMKENGRANVTKRIFFLTDGVPASYWHDVSPCVENDANWTKADLNGMEIIVVQFGAFDSAPLSCLAEYDSQGQAVNFLTANNFNQSSLDSVLRNLADEACPSSEEVAITEVKPVNSPQNAQLGILTEDANSRFIELYNRGTTIDFSTTSVRLSGLVSGTMNSATMGNVTWPAKTFLVIYSTAVPSRPYCRSCLCTFANGAASPADQTNGECGNAIYIAAPNSNLAFAPSTMTGWQLKVNLGSATGKLLDEVRHSSSFQTLTPGFAYSRKTTSYNARSTAGSTGSFWGESCMAFGTPGDKPLQPCAINYPSKAPSPKPTKIPTKSPIPAPTGNPSSTPTGNPSGTPTSNPTKNPTTRPTREPTIFTASPSRPPTPKPTASPVTPSPTSNPTSNPSRNPTANPTRNPTANPTKNPTRNPTLAPTVPCGNCNNGAGTVSSCSEPHTNLNNYQHQTGTIYCCSGNQYVRVGRGASTGVCSPIPILPKPPTCVITISAQQPDSSEVGIANWNSPIPQEPSISYRLFTSQISYFSEILSNRQRSITTKRTLSENRLVYQVTASMIDLTTGLILTSAATTCIYRTLSPTARPVALPTVPLPPVSCAVTITGGTSNEASLQFNRLNRQEAGYALYPSNSPPISLLFVAGNPIKLNFQFADYKTNPSTAFVQVGVLLSTQQDPATVPSHLRHNCTILTVAPSTTPTKNPTTNPTSNPSKNPTRTPTAAPIHPQGEINTCSCTVNGNALVADATFKQNQPPKNPSYTIKDISGGDPNNPKITTGISSLPNTQTITIQNLAGFKNNVCSLQLRQQRLPGQFVTGPFVICTIKTPSPTSRPTSNPTKNPTRNPTANPATSRPTIRPTNKPTCSVYLPECVVTVGGGNTDTGVVRLNDTSKAIGIATPTNQLGVELEQKVDGGSWSPLLVMALTDTQRTIDKGLNYSSTTQFRIVMNAGQGCAGGSWIQNCIRKTRIPTTSPTKKPIIPVVPRPAAQVPGVYIGSQFITCPRNNTERCECAGLTTVTCEIGPQSYDGRTIVQARVTEDDVATRRFSLKRVPAIDPNYVNDYPYDVQVEWELYFDTKRSELGRVLVRDNTTVQNDALAQSNDIQPPGQRFTDNTTILKTESEAKLLFTFPVDADEGEKAYLVIKRVRYGPNKTSIGNIMYPAVARISIESNPAALGVATVAIGEIPWWVWAVIAGAIMVLAAVGFMAYQSYKQGLVNQAKAAEIDRDLANLDTDDPMDLDCNNVQTNPLATGVKGSGYANLGDTFDAARAEARDLTETPDVNVDKVSFRQDFGAVKPPPMAGGGGAGGGVAAMMGGGQMVQQVVVRRQYVVVNDH